MAGLRPFRFLDLPKELRLMCYERFSVATVHRHFKHLENNSIEPIDVQVVWKALPGANLLATCRFIEDEAQCIKSSLAAIRDESCRIIVTPKGLLSADLSFILKRLMRSEANSHDITDPRDIICVALYQPVTQETAKVRVDRALNLINLFWYEAANSTATGHKEGLHVHIRPALLSDEEEALFDLARPVTADELADHSKPAKKVTDGTTIGQDEWDADWAEGERFV